MGSFCVCPSDGSTLQRLVLMHGTHTWQTGAIGPGPSGLPIRESKKKTLIWGQLFQRNKQNVIFLSFSVTLFDSF